MIRFKRRSKYYFGATAALLSTSIIAPVVAQQAPQPAASSATQDLEEITVTARRRNESLQNVPIAVTVLTTQDIARAGIKSVSDYANLTPNVTFDNALSLGNNYLTIRGQTQSQYAPPPAAIVIDGVLTISPLQFNVDEFDLQQIEVLKGPQGAIYGRNAIAGAINITTLKPGPDFESNVLAGYGSGDEWKGKASVSGPVIPGLLYVLAGVSDTDRRGQVRNITTDTYSDKLKDLTTRVRAVITPADDVEGDIKYTYSDTKGHDPDYITSRSGDPAINSDPLDANREGFNPRTIQDLSGKLNWNTSIATATMTLAYVDVSEYVTEDLDYSPLDILAARQSQHDSGFSQELRFAAPAGDALHWLIGGYHLTETRTRAAEIYVDPYYFGLTPAPSSADVLFSNAFDRNHYQTWSAFGQIGYDFTSQWSTEFDLRYDADTLTQTPTVGEERHAAFSKAQPKGTVTYKPVSDLTLYASVGQGFRSGDFNASTASFGNAVVRAEVATTYELGAKSRLFDNRLTLNAAVFETHLKDGQFTLFDAVGATNVGVNIDNTRIRGFELESALRLMEGLKITASFGYTDPKIMAFTPPPGFSGTAATYIGNLPPRVAKETANLGLDYDVPLMSGIDLFVRPQYRYIGTEFWDPENNYKRPDQNLLDLRVGLRQAEDRWTVTGWVKNALNEKKTADYEPYADTGLPTGKDVYYPSVGTMYGVELTYRF